MGKGDGEEIKLRQGVSELATLVGYWAPPPWGPFKNPWETHLRPNLLEGCKAVLYL